MKKNNQLLQFPRSPFDLTSQGCLRADSLFRFNNLSNCLVVQILDLQIVPGVGSKNFSFKIPIYPVTLPDSGSDSLKITYTPDNSTTDSAQLDIKYSVGGEVFEVRVWLRGFVKQGFNVTLSNDLNLLLSSDCSKLDTFVTIRSGLCAADTILAVTLSDPTAFTITPPSLPAAIPSGSSLGIPVSVNSLPPGSYNAFITLRVRSGGITKDTLINLSAIILSASEPRANILPGSAIFDTISVCDLAIDTIILKNTICKTLFINSISIQPPTAASEFSFTLIDKTIPDSLAPKASDTIVVQYEPTAGGLITGYLRFNVGFDLTKTIDTNIGVYGIGKALANSALGSSLLHFADTVPCSVQMLSTHLYNNSCSSDTIVSIIPANDISFTALSPAPPVTIMSGDSALISVQEDPLSPGAKFDSVRMVIHSSSGLIDTVSLKVSGIVNKPIHMLSMISLLQLDSLAACIPFDTIIELKNIGKCDTLQVDSLILSGPNWFSLGSYVAPSGMAPGGMYPIPLHFTPGAGAKGTGTIHIKGIGIDTVISIVASSRQSGGLYALISGGYLFSSSLCKQTSHSFTFENTSCDTIVLDDVSLKNNLTGATQFSFVPVITLPDTIPPGNKLDLIITFDPLGTGDSTAKLIFHSTVNNFGNISKLTGTLAGSRQTANMELVIGASGKQAIAQAGSSITLRLLLQNDIGDTIGLKSAKATIAYFDNVLGVLNPSASNGWVLNSSTPGTGALTLDLSRTNNNSLKAGAEIATVQFEAYVADSTYTPVDLQNLEFNGGDPTFLSCVLSPQALAPVKIIVDSECGTTILRGYLNHDNTVFTGITIRPNPAASGTQINVGVQLHQQTDMKFTLSDALGQTISQISKPSLPKGMQNISFDLPNLESELYILTIEAGGMRESRKIVIEK